MTSELLSVENLNILFQRDSQNTYAVQDLSFDIHTGETLAIVGESGSGKSVSALACLGLFGRCSCCSGLRGALPRRHERQSASAEV